MILSFLFLFFAKLSQVFFILFDFDFILLLQKKKKNLFFVWVKWIDD